MAKIKFNFIGDWPDESKDLAEKVVLSACRELSGLKYSGAVNIKLVDDAAITQLNSQYNGNAYPTDVLSFSYIENGQQPMEGELGDIAISIDMAASQAEQAGTDLATELALLSLHGLLHIAGFDHATEEGRQRMEIAQERILKQHNLTYREFKWL